MTSIPPSAFAKLAKVIKEHQQAHPVADTGPAALEAFQARLLSEVPELFEAGVSAADRDVLIGTIFYGTNQPLPAPVKTNGVQLEPLTGSSAQVFWTKASVTEIPAEMTMVPQWPSAPLSPEERAEGSTRPQGDVRGGVALAQENAAHKFQSEHERLGFVAGNAEGPLKAVNRYDEVRDRMRSKTLPAGHVIVAGSGVENPRTDHFPGFLFHQATVPTAELRWKDRSEFPDDESHVEHRTKRLQYADLLIGQNLAALETFLAEHPELEGATQSWPALGTGNEGFLSYAECGYLMGRRFAEFAERHPNFKFVVSLFRPDDQSSPLVAERARREFALGYQSGATGKDMVVADGGLNPTGETLFRQAVAGLDGCFAPLTNGERTSGVKHATLDAGLVNRKFDDWANRLLGEARTMSAETLSERGTAHKFRTRLDGEAFWQLAKYSEIPALTPPAPGQSPAEMIGFQPVTPERIQDVLRDPSLRQDVITLIQSAVGEHWGEADAFRAEERLPNVIAGAVTYVLQQRRWQYMDQQGTAFKEEMKQQIEAVSRLEEQFNRKAAADRKTIDRLKKELMTALETGQDSTEALEKFRKEAVAAAKRAADATQEVDALTRELQKQIQIAEKYRAQAEAAQTSASRYSYSGTYRSG